MKHRQQMLDDVEDEALNPLNIQVPSHLSQRAQEDSYQIQLRKIYEIIEEKRYGPEGKPVYEDIDERTLYDLAGARKRVAEKEAVIWDQER